MWFASPPWEALTFWALDLETDGLDAARDAILAVGMVPIRQGVIRLGERFESLVRPPPGAGPPRPDAVAIHGLVPGDVREAPALAGVLEEVARRLEEGPLLVHNASVDVAFLQRAFASQRRRWPKPAVVDTVKLLLALEARRHFIEPDAPGGDPELNLSAARRQLGLPGYPAHDALTDAVATAELFLVLRDKLGAKTLRELR